jgi:hypothetical protein
MRIEQHPKRILRVSKSGWTAGITVFHQEETRNNFLYPKNGLGILSSTFTLCNSILESKIK